MKLSNKHFALTGKRGILWIVFIITLLFLFGCKEKEKSPTQPQPTPNIVFTPNPLYFGRIPFWSSATRQVLIFNNGSESVTIQSVAITGENANEFVLQSSPTTPFTLDPLKSAPLTVQYQPSAAGTSQALLTASITDGGFVDTLQGIGTENMGGISTFERIIGSNLDDGANTLLLIPGQGGYLLVGSTIPSETDEFSDVYVVMTDLFGKVLWSFHGGGVEADGGSGAAAHSDGGFLISGNTNSYGAGGQDGYLIKLNAAGLMEWSTTYGGPFSDQLSDIIKLNNGEYLLVGNTLKTTGTDRDAWVLRIDGQGNVIWELALGGNQTGENFNAAIETGNGNLLIVGSVSSGQTGDLDILAVMLDGMGNVLWQQTYGATGQELWEEAFDVQSSSDSSFILCGYTSSKGAGGRDVYVLKIDGSGNLIWDKTFGTSRNESAGSIGIDMNGDIYLSGSIVNRVTQQSQFTDGYVLKLTGDGSLQWEANFGGDSNDSFGDLVIAPDGGVVSCGSTFSFGKSTDIYFVKFTPDGSF